ncbi:polysaccharide deacetylase family protein [Janibacter sp. G349]|uniref:polysaccharide deacetylase family protein n=1 Tax=unclassified Janibacter TaxID=2649294 RepID=UPI003B774907
MKPAAVALAALAAGQALPSATAIAPLRAAVAPGLAGRAEGRHIALTFDDGPDPRSTPAFLDLLAQEGRRATFFLLGSQAADHPDLVRRIVADGHEVALHGWIHRCVLAIPPGTLTRQLRAGRSLLEDLTGQRVEHYRPPYGVLGTEALIACRRLGLTPVLWTAWGREWEWGATADTVVTTATRRLRPGGTLLLHDTDLHAPHGDWRRTHEATRRLLRGDLATAEVGPLREHRAA